MGFARALPILPAAILTRRANQLCDSHFHFVQSPSKKYFCFSEMQITAIFASVPSHQKGRIMIVANAGRDAVDAEECY